MSVHRGASSPPAYLDSVKSEMTAKKSQPELSDRYYLDNFNCLVDFVFEHYSHLLNHEETQFYQHYISLPENSQRLAIRLLSRSSDYLRTSKIHYDEIVDINQALEPLYDAEIIAAASTDDVSDWLSVFTRKELQSCLAVPAPTKEFAARLLTTPDLFGDTPVDTLLDSDQVIRITGKQWFTTYRLLFFGNLYQDLSAFVLRDLGVRTFERYSTDTNTLPFKSRSQLDAYLAYYVCIESFEEADAQGPSALITLQEQLPKTDNRDLTLTRRVERFSNKIARQLERHAAFTDAAEIFARIDRPPARERLARIKARLGHHVDAYNLCQQIEDAPADAEEKEFAQQFAAKLAPKVGTEYRAPEKHIPDEIIVTLPPGNLPVEFAAALHFAKFGKCYYVENSLIGGIFGLAIWDILFASIPGAFYHPFQNAPADFHESDFYAQRKNLFEQRFDDIKAGQLRKIVLSNFHHKYGINNPLVHWGYLNRHLICVAIKHIPVKHWIAYFEYLLADIRNNRSGLPDLIHFPDDDDYILLEVKGPGDRLQKNQLRWMKHFKHNGIRHAVVPVRFEDNQCSGQQKAFQGGSAV